MYHLFLFVTDFAELEVIIVRFEPNIASRISGQICTTALSRSISVSDSGVFWIRNLDPGA